MKKKFISALIMVALAITLALPWSSNESGGVYYNNQVMVLMYHHIDNVAKSSATITTALFDDQLNYLVNKGYHFISISQFKQFMTEGASVPDNAILLTFDDGYESYALHALPTMKKLGLPSINFIITDNLANPHSGSLRYLSREQISNMLADTPLAAIGCHTDRLHTTLPNGKAALVSKLTLQDGTLESDASYHKRIAKDISVCRSKVNALANQHSDTFAYPYGINSPPAIAALKEAGIRYAFTLIPQMTTRGTDPLRIPRLNAGSPGITPQALHHFILQRVESSLIAK
jgi:poly-beta-1,6-N-acetyl-D-glucosamine N-deacetylase